MQFDIVLYLLHYDNSITLLKPLVLLTLSEIRGHKGQKGQILQSAANGLKRVEN